MTARLEAGILLAGGAEQVHRDIGALRERFGQHHARGTVLARQGDPGGHLFLVLEGRLERSVTSGGVERPAGTVGPGEIFGVTSCFTGAAHTATIVAATDALVLRFDQETAEDLIHVNGRFALAVIEGLVERLRDATERRIAGLVQPAPADNGKAT